MYKLSLINLITFLLMVITLLVAYNEINAADKKLEMIWNFDEGGGDVAKEANKTGNDGEFTGAGKDKIKWVEGIAEKALEFSGKVGGGQWVEVPHSDDMDIRDAITMEAWVYPTTIDGEKRTIITKAAYYLQIEPTSQVATYFYEVVPPGYHLSNGRVNENEWSHVAVTYNGKEIKFYINGKEDSKVIKAKGQIKSQASWGVHLGGERDGCCPRYFQGAIDEIKISNYAKTRDEILKSVKDAASVSPQAKLSLVWGAIKRIKY